MIEFNRPNVSSVLSDDGRNGIITIEPLERGYGTTMGNSIRRVLLSSVPGTAVTSIKIDGVLHEFSTIDGVKEDVTEIVLNVKGIVAKLHTKTEKTAVIDMVGPCNVTDADIRADSDLTILNPDHHIATLSEGTRFYMELTFEHGRGYVSADKNKMSHDNAPLGTIFVDSIFTPVYAVNYTVENTRVGSSTDYDKLTLEVTTNGVQNANEAVVYAGDILNAHFCSLHELCEIDEKPGFVETEEKAMEKQLSISIDEMDFSVRSYNCLKRAGIDTIGDLTTQTPTNMRKIRNLGEKSYREIALKLEERGLSFAEEE